jgi:hypothetical protein
VSRPNAALALLVDPLWAAARLPGGGTDLAAIAAALADGAPGATASPHPFVDPGFIADAYLGADAGASALDVLLDYAERLLPLGVSPHPLVVGDVYLLCRPRAAALEAQGRIRSWVEHLLADPDETGTAVLPILDGASLLGRLGLSPAALRAHGAASVSRLYLGELAARGALPHPRFDPVFVHAERTSTLPAAAALEDPGRFLKGELRRYLLDAANGRAGSPSATFDEAFYRARHPAAAAAIEARRVVSGFHHFVASGSPATLRATASGLDGFAEAAPPDPWWQGRLEPARRRGDAADLVRAEAARRVRAARPPPVAAHVDCDLPDVVRPGEAVTVVAHGTAASPAGRIVGVELAVGSDVVAGPFQGFPRLDRPPGDVVATVDRVFCGFAIAWAGPAAAGTVPVALRFLVARGRTTLTSAPVAIGSFEVKPRPIRRRSGPAPTVAIAMATYNPDLARLAAQIGSIRGQAMRDWALVISDESTSVAAREALAAHARADTRIRVTHGPRRGFLGNFERSLREIDPRSTFFAFADQDDVWHPDKLSILVAAIRRTGAALVYGDMRTVAADGGLIDRSFFAWRRRHAHRAEELLLANTVSGTAMLARTELLKTALPFPRHPGIYHDMWLAMVAARRGGVRFVDRPLLDYVQHEANVIGHSGRDDRLSALRFSLDGRVAATVGAALEPAATAPGDATLDSACTRLMPVAAGIRPAAVQIGVLALTLAARIDAKAPQPDALSLPALAALAAGLADGPGRDDERRFLNIPAWLAAGTRLLARVASDRRLAERLAAGALASLEAAESAGRDPGPAEPSAPRIAAASAHDVTLLVAALPRASRAEGSPLAFSLALALADAGLSVRIAVTGNVWADLEGEARLAGEVGARRFDRIAVEEWGRADRAVALNGNEALVATSARTAHLASALRPGRPFVYLIERWETVDRLSSTSPAAAEASYALPHDALFATGALARAFRSRRAGAFSAAARAAGAAAVILSASPATERIARLGARATAGVVALIERRRG